MVPETGIEPVRTDEGSTDFKSVVSTNFTTRAMNLFLKPASNEAGVFYQNVSVASA
jgi:hypothetical protein